MRWRRAWTGELATGHYTKLDITLDPDDLERLVAEHLPGLEPGKLTTHEAWLLLEQEAETLLAAEQVSRLDHNVVQNTALIARLNAERAALLITLRTKYGLVRDTPEAP